MYIIHLYGILFNLHCKHVHCMFNLYLIFYFIVKLSVVLHCVHLYCIIFICRIQFCSVQCIRNLFCIIFISTEKREEYWHSRMTNTPNVPVTTVFNVENNEREREKKQWFGSNTSFIVICSPHVRFTLFRILLCSRDSRVCVYLTNSEVCRIMR